MIRSGAAWRNVAKGMQKEASQMGLDGVKKSVDDAVAKAEKSISKNNPKYPDVPIHGKAKAEEMVDYLNNHNGSTPKNVKGRGEYKNKNNKLPSGEYQEYDLTVRTFKGDGGRGTERIVVNMKTGEVWYTKNHYETFEKLETLFKTKK